MAGRLGVGPFHGQMEPSSPQAEQLFRIKRMAGSTAGSQRTSPARNSEASDELRQAQVAASASGGAPGVAEAEPGSPVKRRGGGGGGGGPGAKAATPDSFGQGHPDAFAFAAAAPEAPTMAQSPMTASWGDVSQQHLDQLSTSYSPEGGMLEPEEVTSPMAIRHTQIKKNRAAQGAQGTLDPYQQRGGDAPWPQEELGTTAGAVAGQDAGWRTSAALAQDLEPFSPQAHELRRAKVHRQRETATNAAAAARSAPGRQPSPVPLGGGMDQSALDRLAQLAPEDRSPSALSRHSAGSAGLSTSASARSGPSPTGLGGGGHGGLTQAQLDRFTSSLEPPPEEGPPGGGRCGQAAAFVAAASHYPSPCALVWPSHGDAAVAAAAAGYLLGDGSSEPSSPMASQLRRAKQQNAVRSSSGNLSGGPPTTGPHSVGKAASPSPAPGMGQAELDALSQTFGAADGVAGDGYEPSSPQAKLLLHRKRQGQGQGQGTWANSGAPAVVSQLSASHGAGTHWQSPSGASIGQDELNSLSLAFPASPDGARSSHSGGSRDRVGSPFFPPGGPRAASSIGAASGEDEGDSSPLARQLRAAKRGHAHAASSSSAAPPQEHAFFPPGGPRAVSSGGAGSGEEGDSSPQARQLCAAKRGHAHAAPSWSVAASQEPRFGFGAGIGAGSGSAGSGGVAGLSQAELNVLSEAVTPSVGVPSGAGYNEYESGDFADASPLATRMQHAKRAAQQAQRVGAGAFR